MTRDIPQGATKVCDKLSDAIAYLFASVRGEPAMMVFYGQQSKPVARFRYSSEAKREEAVKRYFDGRRRHAAVIAENTAERKSAVATVRFEVGKTYHDRATSDWDTIYSYKIVARTEKILTIEEYGKTSKRGIYVYNGIEHCKPHGTYSMCSVIGADETSV
jgi:hypothetical protein